MPCYAPMRAWRGVRDRAIYWRQVNDSTEISLACGQCWGCRLERSRQWAIRCIHEAKGHSQNSFITLTYDDKYLPQKYNSGLKRPNGAVAYAGNLRYRDVQLFLKRYREALSRTTAKASQTPPVGKISYYLAGEYGELYWRPHWHICLFGHSFNDQIYHRTTITGSKLYTSSALQQLWPFGYSSIGELNYESAAYVARYVMKKITGDPAKKHYEKLDHDTGEIIKLVPEFNKMSKRPAIGKKFIEKYKTDIYPHGYVINKARKTKPPLYYDKQFKKLDPIGYQEMKETREIQAIYQWEENEPDRLKVREAVARAQVRSLKRQLA